MQINLTPVRTDRVLTLAREGEALIVAGQRFDFEQMSDGEELLPDAAGQDWFVGPVTKRDGIVCLTLLWPHGAGRAPAPRRLDIVADGPVTLPET